MTLQDSRDESAPFNAMVQMNFDEKEFREKLVDFLVAREHTPDGLIEKVIADQTQNAIAIYIPFLRYRLSFDGAMTCDAGREFQQKSGGSSTVWEPFQRNLKGRFSLDICASKHIDENLHSALEQALESVSLKRFQPAQVLSHAVEHSEVEVEPEGLYTRRGLPRLELHVASLAKESAPTLNRNIKSSFDYKIEEKIPYLVAVWIYSYEYGGVDYRLVMDSHSGKVIGTAPEDGEKTLLLEELKKLGVLSLGPAIAFGVVAEYLGQSFFVVALVTLGTFLMGHGLGEWLSKRVQDASTRYRLEMLASSQNPNQSGDMSTSKLKLEEEQRVVEAQKRTIKKIYIALIALAAIVWTVGESMQGSKPRTDDSWKQATPPPSAATAPRVTKPTKLPREDAQHRTAKLPAAPVDHIQASDDRRQRLLTPAMADVVQSKVGAEKAILEDKSKTFVERLFSDWSGNDETASAALEGLYAAEVMFYGGVASRHEIIKQKKLFIKRWPLRDYKVREGEFIANCTLETRVCHVVGLLDWTAVSEPRGARSEGVAEFEYTIDHSLDTPRIVLENGRVLERDKLRDLRRVSSPKNPPEQITEKILSALMVPSSEVFTNNGWSRLDDIFPELEWSDDVSNDHPYSRRSVINTDDGPVTIGAHGARSMILQMSAGFFSEAGIHLFSHYLGSNSVATGSNSRAERLCSQADDLLYGEVYYQVEPQDMKPILVKLEWSSGSAGTTETITAGEITVGCAKD